MDRDVDKILMNIQNTGKMTGSFIFLNAQMAMLLFTFLMRMKKEGVLKGGEIGKYEKFLKATGGKFDVMNVPLVGSDQKEIVSQLNEMKIRYNILPDLNKEDNLIQVAVFHEDRQKFGAWYERHILNQLKEGGEKNIEDLNNLTDSRTSIVSVPIEGLDEKVKQDFDALSINYAMLPDLHVGDGNIQFLIANADLPSVEHWFSLHKEEQLGENVDIGDMKVISKQEYTATGMIDAEKYINSAGADIKQLNDKYEGSEKGDLEKETLGLGNKVRTIDDASYDKIHGDPNYLEITINHKSLVDNSSFGNDPNILASGQFASRIPGTYGNTEQTLVIPSNDVFSTDNGKTYIAFIEKNSHPLVMDSEGRPIGISQRKTGQQLFDHYDEVNRNFQNKVKNQMQDVTKDLAQDIQEKIPANPLKAR